MNWLLQRLASDGKNAWLRLVGWLNGLSASLFTAISAAYAAYPDSTKEFLKHLPAWLIFPAAVAFFAFIHHALKRAGNNGNS